MSKWDTRTLEDLGYMIQIARGVPTSRTLTTGSVPVRSVPSLIGDTEPTTFIETDDLYELNVLTSQVGDLLIAIEGSSVGDSFYVTPNLPIFVPSQQTVTVRVTESSILNSEYLAAWTASPEARQQLLRLARGGGMQRITFSDVLKLSVPLPPMEVQIKIVSCRARFNEAIAQHLKILEVLRELRDIDLVLLFNDSDAGPEVSVRSPGQRQ